MYRENLENKLSKNKVRYSCTHKNKIKVNLHWHEAYEVLYVRSGNAEQRINTATFRIAAGDVVVIKSGDVHSTYTCNNDLCDIDYIQFKPDILTDSETVLASLSSGVIHPDNKSIARLFDGLREIKNCESLGGELMSVGYIYALCGMLVNTVNKENREYPSIVMDICRYIESNSDVRLEAVASHFGYSAEHLSRLFHREMGSTYREFCTGVKMRKAIGYLNENKSSLSEIAVSLGYADESSFIRAFKRIYGITPSAFKRRQRVIGEFI